MDKAEDWTIDLEDNMRKNTQSNHKKKKNWEEWGWFKGTFGEHEM